MAETAVPTAIEGESGSCTRRGPSGISIGDPESALVAAYGSNLTSKPLFDGPGTQYVYTPTDASLGDRRLVFDVIDGKVAVMNLAKTSDSGARLKRSFVSNNV